MRMQSTAHNQHSTSTMVWSLMSMAQNVRDLTADSQKTHKNVETEHVTPREMRVILYTTWWMLENGTSALTWAKSVEG